MSGFEIVNALYLDVMFFGVLVVGGVFVMFNS